MPLPPPETWYAPLPARSSKPSTAIPAATTARDGRIQLTSLWPATLNAANGFALVLYVVVTVALTIWAYVAPQPDIWAVCVVSYVVLIFFVLLLAFVPWDEHRQHHTLPR